MSPNEHIKHNEVVLYPYRNIGSDHLYGSEHWLLEKAGIYTLEIFLVCETVTDEFKRMFHATLEDGRGKYFERITLDPVKQPILGSFDSKYIASMYDEWTFNISEPNTRLTIDPLAYMEFMITKGYIKLYYKMWV